MRDRKINPSTTNSGRTGFTLIELLMVITILAVLGGLALSMIGGARHDANAARTETQIRRIKQFIQARLEDYAVRMLPYRPSLYSTGGIPLTRAEISSLRNRILIEYIRAEMPCRLSQVSDPMPPAVSASVFPSAHFVADFGMVDRANTVPPMIPPRILLVDEMKNDPPSLVKRMARELKTSPPPDTVNEQAECLYEILNSHNDYGSSGMDFIFQAEIGDKDRDGHFEILDAWGDPMEFSLHMHDHEGDTLDVEDPDGGMDTEGPLAVHIDVTSVNMPN